MLPKAFSASWLEKEILSLEHGKNMPGITTSIPEIYSLQRNFRKTLLPGLGTGLGTMPQDVKDNLAKD